MKVFLGGTCPGWNWREELIPMLKCDYFNPLVETWSEENRLREVKERAESDYVLYTITNDMTGVYSIAEVIDDSNKKPCKTIFCNLNNDESLNLISVERLLLENGAIVFHSLENVAEYLNREI